MDRIEDMLDPNEDFAWFLVDIEDPDEKRAVVLYNQSFKMTDIFRQIGRGEPESSLRDRASRFFRTKRIQKAVKLHKIWADRASAEELNEPAIVEIIDSGIRTTSGQTQIKYIELRDKRVEKLQVLKAQQDSNPVELFRRLASQHSHLSDEWFTELARGMGLSPERLLCSLECDLRPDGDMRRCSCRRFKADLTDSDDDGYRAALAQLRSPANRNGGPGPAAPSPRPGGISADRGEADGTSPGAAGKAPGTGSGEATEDSRAYENDAVASRIAHAFGQR